MIPTSRHQTLALLAALDWDEDRLTEEQRQAIRELYKLVPLPPGARYLTEETPHE